MRYVCALLSPGVLSKSLWDGAVEEEMAQSLFPVRCSENPSWTLCFTRL